MSGADPQAIRNHWLSKRLSQKANWLKPKKGGKLSFIGKNKGRKVK